MVLLKLIIYHLNRLLRNGYWLYNLGRIKGISTSKLSFPIICEGKGNLIFGAQLTLESQVNLGIALKGRLKGGDFNIICQESTILINENCQLTIGDRFKLGKGSRLYIQNNWEFGNDVSIETNCAVFSREPNLYGRLYLKNNSHIADGCIIDVSDDIIIMENVAIGPNCTFYTHDHEYTDFNLPAWGGEKYSKKIVVGKNSWLGSNVTILPGVIIGDHVVVAAGSVVTKDLDSKSVYGGVPAKLIRKINDK